MSETKNAYDYVSGSTIGVELEKTQINKFHTRGGTGFAAEEANAQADVWSGVKVEQVGKSNELNGADRVSDGIKIQTKYFDSAARTTRAAFGDDGMYRYGTQQLEVPSDQFDECVELMRNRILAGAVPGVDNPDDAAKLVRKGSVTYRQARNIAKAGTIDGLCFDAKTQAVTTTYAFALSFLINFARSKWEGRTYEASIGDSLKAAIQSGGTSFVTGIITAQVLRTRAAAVGVVVMRSGVKTVASTGLGRSAVHKIAEVSLGKAVYGAAAVNHVSKLLRTNVVTGVATTIVVSAPDFYRAAFEGSISWAQCAKNVSVTAAGVAGGTGGWMAGAIAGAALGSAVPGLGTAAGGVTGAILGSLAIGATASSAAQHALDYIVEDDAKQMVALLPRYLDKLACDYVLSEAETTSFSEKLAGRFDTAFLRSMFKSEDRGAFVYETLEPICQEIVASRCKVSAPEPSDVQAQIDDIVRAAESAMDAAEREPGAAVHDEDTETGLHQRGRPHQPDLDQESLRRWRAQGLDNHTRRDGSWAQADAVPTEQVAWQAMVTQVRASAIDN